MKIVYLLITHKNERQIRRLVARLRAGSNSFVLIHHDYGNGVSLDYHNCSDVHVIRDYVPVKWGDESLMLAKIRGIRWLEEENFDFDWLITISGQDYPVQPLHRIESFLENTTREAFVHHEFIHENPNFHQRPWQTQTWRHYFFRRVRLLGKEYWFKRRHPYRKGLKCYAGSNWLNLSRKAVEYLWSKKKLESQLVRYLRGTFSPDETFFHTMLLNDSGLDIDNDYKRFILWREDLPNPLPLCLEHFDAMIESGAFFARKFDDNDCPEVLDRLDEVLFNR